MKRRGGGGAVCFGRELGKGRDTLERSEGRREWVGRKGRGKGIRRGKGWALKPVVHLQISLARAESHCDLGLVPNGHELPLTRLEGSSRPSISTAP